MPDLKIARRKFKELQAHNKRGLRFRVNREKAEISQYGLFILIDNDFRRLILKMCVAFSRKMNKDQTIIDDGVLLYLSDSERYHHAVSFDFNHYSLLDAAVPALAHSIYIETCPQRGQAYALVRLFGTFQFFTILHNNYQGSQFAGIGVLNPIDFSEKFQLIEPILHLAEIPQYVLPFLAGYHTRNMYRRSDSKILQTFGKNEYTFAPDEMSMILSQIRISVGLS